MWDQCYCNTGGKKKNGDIHRTRGTVIQCEKLRFHFPKGLPHFLIIIEIQFVGLQINSGRGTILLVCVWGVVHGEIVTSGGNNKNSRLNLQACVRTDEFLFSYQHDAWMSTYGLLIQYISPLNVNLQLQSICNTAKHVWALSYSQAVYNDAKTNYAFVDIEPSSACSLIPAFSHSVQ